ncbi:LysR family transcriptional regulator [Comamonas jiangduensis]|uniref:LysR family transcriptional regulator n=1 Tax=Comamonas jiangduensis TaxID=1194168 RepID=UPI003BF82D4F
MLSPFLELRHLRTLSALHETGNLARAAQLLNVTQSALSHQIKFLEERYGSPLFERKSTPLKFSAIGERILELGTKILPEVEQAERDLLRLSQGGGGTLRIVVECHTCFDWLMPAMDVFRQRWPDVELDIVSGFHPDPVALILQNRAEVAIVGEPDDNDPVVYHPLFRYEMLALVAKHHQLAERSYLEAQDFADEVLISYPIPDDMLDIMRQVLVPAGVTPAGRRTSELTVAMLQLVASGRGIATLPMWTVQSYLDKGYVIAKPVTKQGLHAHLYMTSTPEVAQRPWMADFVRITRESTFKTLPGIELL